MLRRLKAAILSWTLVGLFAGATQSAETPPIKGLLYNEDCTQMFVTETFPPGKAGETIDQCIDKTASGGVTVFLCNTNGRRTNYASRVWESFWDGYDPTGPDDQPFLAPVPRSDMKEYRTFIGNMQIVHQQGIDYPARVVQRCRHDGMSPWISLRMNDCHNNENPLHPFHGSFWKKHPQFVRNGATGYFARCLDYAHPEVRDLYESLIVETLDRYDIDGLELDFMRTAYCFSVGKEAEGAAILTQWMRGIHQRVAAASARRGHAIHLGVRVPSHPEAALGLGLDAVAWAKEGLIDVLIVSPGSTLEFDMPLAQWRELLGPSKAILAGGLENNYRPHPAALPSFASPEFATGAAVSALSSGADVVYLFNYCNYCRGNWPLSVFQETLRPMCSLDALLRRPRRVAVTYRDTVAPSETYRPPLPATGKRLAFSLNLGPLPDAKRSCKLLMCLASSQGAAASVPAVLVNGKPCTIHGDTTTKGIRMLTFGVPASALTGTSVHKIEVAGKDQNDLTVERLEMSLD